MKIKYFDKLHNKIKNDPYFKVKLNEGITKVTSVALSLTILTGIYVTGKKIGYDISVKDSIANTDYMIDDGSVYDVKNIFILYNDKEIRLCKRVQELNAINSENEYIYRFYDLKTKEMIGSTEYSVKSSEKIVKYYKDDAMKNMSGYEYINLGEKLKKDALKEYDNLEQQYIDEYIENKRFLGR